MANRGSAEALSLEQLIDELAYLYSTRHRTLRFAPDSVLEEHSRRIADLEREYQQRMPEREVDTSPENGDFAAEHTPSATDPAQTGRSSLRTDEHVDRPTRA